MSTVLVIGSTGQVGRIVVEEALERGLTVKAQSRNSGRAQQTLPDGVEIVETSPVSPDDLRPLVTGVDAVVLTHGGDVDGEGESVSTPPSPHCWRRWETITSTSAS